MTPALIALLPALVNAGIATIAQVKLMIASFNPGMTDAEMNAICDLVAADATRRLALATADSQPVPGVAAVTAAKVG